VNGEPIRLHDLLTSRLWRVCRISSATTSRRRCSSRSAAWGRIGEAFARQLSQCDPLWREGDGHPAGRAWRHPSRSRISRRGGTVEEAKADWCVCALPLTILSQLDVNVSASMKAAIGRGSLFLLHQDRAAIQAPFLGRGRAYFRRHLLYRPADPPDLPIRAPAIIPAARGALGAYTWDGPNSFELTAMSPAEAHSIRPSIWR